MNTLSVPSVIISSVDVSNTTHYVSVLVDSGAAVKFIHNDLVQELNIPIMQCIPWINVYYRYNNEPVGQGITQQTIPITLQVGLFHTEKISLYFISSPKIQIILGHPCLAIHDPVVPWNQRKLNKCSYYCQEHYFNSRITLPCFTTSLESPGAHNTMAILIKYSEFSEVFNKAKATQHTSPSPMGSCHWTSPKFSTSQKQSLPPIMPWDTGYGKLHRGSPGIRLYPSLHISSSSRAFFVDKKMVDLDHALITDVSIQSR